MLVVLSGGTGGAGSIPAACACHARLGSACNFGAAGVPCPPWTSFASPRRGAEPCPSPGCSQRSPRTGGLLQPIPTPRPAHPASLFPHSASRDPAERPVPAMPGPAPSRTPRDGSQAAAQGGGCPYPCAICPWLPRPCSPPASTPPSSACSSHRAGDTAPAAPLPAHAAGAPGPRTALVPTARAATAPCCRASGTAGSVRGSCHGTRCAGNMAAPGSLPPACGQPARPGRARDSLGFPAQEPFPPAPAGHSPTGGFLPGLLLPGWRGRAGVRAQLCIPWPQPKPPRAGLGDARRGPGGIAASPGPGHRGLLGGRPPVRPPAASPACAQLVGRVPAACSQGC